jgi:hypothetical protein
MATIITQVSMVTIFTMVTMIMFTLVIMVNESSHADGQTDRYAAFFSCTSCK